MGNNPSVKRFRTDVQDWVGQVGKTLRERTLAMADELIENMRDVAPRDTGTLAGSLRKKDVTKGGNGHGSLQEVSVLVIGGGAPTIKRGPAGPYDYSIATEFGTRKENPEPFFYTTYRAYRNHGLEIFKETLDEAVKENNELRAIRAEGSSGSIIHRGAITNQKAK